MNGIPYGWAAWAAANAVAGNGFAGFDATAGSVALGAVTVALGTRALLDLKAAYGPVTAVAGPALVTGSGLLADGHSAAPAAVSVALAVLSHSARKAARS